VAIYKSINGMGAIARLAAGQRAIAKYRMRDDEIRPEVRVALKPNIDCAEVAKKKKKKKKPSIATLPKFLNKYAPCPSLRVCRPS
jgi:hypothetical protein